MVTDFSHSQWFIVVVDFALAGLLCEDVGHIPGISEEHVSSSIRPFTLNHPTGLDPEDGSIM
jgi:hypothetical protein